MKSNRDKPNIYDQGLDKNAANYAALSPINFLEWSFMTYPAKTAVVYGKIHRTYTDVYQRCLGLAQAVTELGIGKGDTVSVLMPNLPEMLEAHFAIPMTGAVLNCINYRLDADTIAFILNHAESKLLIVDSDMLEVSIKALQKVDLSLKIVEVVDREEGHEKKDNSFVEYEDFIRNKGSQFSIKYPADEWQSITLNYTSGTTGMPKGVVYHHRGAFLNAMSNALIFGLNAKAVYLWTLPMFHCNGWTYTWGVTAVGGTHVCLRNVQPQRIFELIAEHRVTHMCGAPIVLNTLIHAREELQPEIEHQVEVAVGGAPPPSQVVAAMEEMNFRVTHLYGLTETFGPATICVWQDEWSSLSLEERSSKLSRQGVHSLTLTGLRVVDTEGQDVPHDGESIGEVLVRGNTVMKGYLKNSEASAEAFQDGWYHTGDLAVIYPDGYMQVKDRLKDIIISGGENISTIEIENALYKHPAILDAAVVAKPDEKWGETPCAFITLKDGADNAIDQDEILAWCRKHMAGFKIPKKVVFSDLPKTSTGKIQKFVLRQWAKELEV